jgi:hypothetical protein
MSQLKKVGDLEINQDLKFRKKEEKAERSGWIAMLAIGLLAMLGLFGRGLLSNATAANWTLQVKYGRFERMLAPAQFLIQVEPEQAGSGELKLQVGRDLLSFYKIERITPDPDSEELSPDQVTYTFKVNPGEQPLKFTFNLQSNKIGITRGRIGVQDGPAVEITQLIYP